MSEDCCSRWWCIRRVTDRMKRVMRDAVLGSRRPMAQSSRAEEPGAKLICDLSQDSQLSFPSEEEAKDKGR
jgi:hypothetical protein